MAPTADRWAGALRRVVMIALGMASIMSAVHVASWAVAIDVSSELKTHLLAGETVPTVILEGAARAELPECETEAQTGAALADLALADSAIKSGHVDAMDLNLSEMDSRVDAILDCAPTNSFAWLLKFWRATFEGDFDDVAASYLERSYQSGPRESWIVARRLKVAAPFYDRCTATMRREMIKDFTTLALDDMGAEAAAGYASASESAQADMRKSLEDAPERIVDRFDTALVERGLAPAFDLEFRRRLDQIGPVKVD